MAIIFNNEDVALLASRFTTAELRRERHRAKLDYFTAAYWEDEDAAGYWQQYLEVVECALKRHLHAEAKQYPLKSGNVDARIVKERLDIVDVIGQHTKLRKTGNRFTGLCPLHDEKHPSLFVYPDQKSWWCYSCNRGGDVFDFIQALNKVDFKQAASMLAGVVR